MFWISQGGVEEKDATNFDAAIREVWEETKYVPKDLHIYGDLGFTKYPGKDKINVLWFAELTNTKKSPRLDKKEHSKSGWYTKEKVLAMVGNSAVTELVEQYHDSIVDGTFGQPISEDEHEEY